MNRPESEMDASHATQAADDFSLVAGGPLYRLLLGTRLARSPMELSHLRLLLIPALAWVPLLVLSVVDRHALGGVALPFLRDFEAHARFLLALPILLEAELLVHHRMRHIIEQFRERGIVPEASRARFEAALASAMRWRDSLTVEVVLLILVVVIGPLAWEFGLAQHTDTWYATMNGSHLRPTKAGWWFFCVSAPIFQFLLLRWYFRLAIWWRLAWQLGRLPLQLSGLNPDRAGGIGFLGHSLIAFAPVLFAQSAVVSGIMFSRVLTGADRAVDFRGEIALLVVFLVAQIVVPLLFFAPTLIAARDATMRKMGRYASTYVRNLDGKWLQHDAKAGDPPLDGDIRMLTNLATSDDVVRRMRLAPFDLRMLARLTVVISIPFAPLVLTVIPFGDLVQRVAGMLL